MKAVKLLSALICVMSILVLSSPKELRSQTPENEKTRIIEIFRERDQRIKAILDEPGSVENRREALKELINGIFDFEAMGREALKTHWNELSETDRTNFIRAFADLIRENSLRDLDIYRAEIEYLNVELNGREASLVTRATYKDKQTLLTYRLVFKNGQWWVVDFLIDDVSTVASYRRSFNRLIKKYGFDGLMERIHRKIESLRQQKTSQKVDSP